MEQTVEQRFYDAVSSRRFREARDLLQSYPNLDVNLPCGDAGGNTALHRACEKGRGELVSLLLQACPGLRVNARNAAGQTPLLFACVAGNVEALSVLLRDTRLDCAAADPLDGWTPAWGAALNGHVDALQWLLASGRELRLEARGRLAGEELTPSQIAGKEGHTEAAALIDAAVANPMQVTWALRQELGIPVTRLEDVLGFAVSLCAGAIPAEFAEPGDVTALSLADCGLTALPPQLDAFSHLVELNLSWNKLAVLPDRLEWLRSLKRLHVHHNQLVSLPAWYAKLDFGTELDLSENPLCAEAVDLVVSIVKEQQGIKSLALAGVPLGPQGTYALLRAIVARFGKAGCTVQTIEMDPSPLASFDGLDMIPVDILEQGSAKIVDFVIDLFSAPEAVALYRSKLMVVGYENVGKTTLVDCLFPLEGWLMSQGKVKKTAYWFRLQGNRLSKYDRPEDETPHKGRFTMLENGQWELTTPANSLEIRLTPKKRAGGAVAPVEGHQKVLELHCPNRATYDAWLPRLRRLCSYEPTHGADIQTRTIDNAITQEYFRAKTGGAGKGVLELAVWDFAGQHVYYQSHQYFLSARTLFLVLWNLREGDEGFRGLEFWLRLLATRLVVPASADKRGGDGGGPSSTGVERTYFSVMVVGTFLDHPSVKREEKNLRAMRVDELSRECGLSTALQYLEVSCSSSLEQMDVLQDAVYKTVLSHSYMGERVPATYLAIEKHVKRLREDRQEFPVTSISELNRPVQNLGLLKRALGLLSQWGECVYFDSPAELASVVIVDPRFLARNLLADFFHPETKELRVDGVVRHAHLPHVLRRFKTTHISTTGKDFNALLETFHALLERLGVCFTPEQDRRKPFLERTSLIPSLLPDQPLDRAGGGGLFAQCWPPEAPFNRPVQVERTLRFTALPADLVSRFLVQVRAHIQTGLVARHEVLLLLKSENAQAWVRADVERLRFIVVVRAEELTRALRAQDWMLAQARSVGGHQYERLLLPLTEADQVISSTAPPPTAPDLDETFRSLQSDLARPENQPQGLSLTRTVHTEDDLARLLANISELDDFIVPAGDQQNPQGWGTVQVIGWLEREGLVSLMPLAKEQFWGGAVLHGLSQLRDDAPSFKAECGELGITSAPLQASLKAKLATLFGS